MKKRPKKKIPTVKMSDVIEEVDEEGEQTPHYSRKLSKKLSGKVGDGTPKIKRQSSIRQIVDWLASVPKREVPAVKVAAPNKAEPVYSEEMTDILVNRIAGLSVLNEDIETHSNIG